MMNNQRGTATLANCGPRGNGKLSLPWLAAALAVAKLQNPNLAVIQDLQTKSQNYFHSIPRPNMLAGPGISAGLADGLARG